MAGVDGSGFAERGSRPVNPKFFLGDRGRVEGVDQEDFGVGRSGSSGVGRVPRPVPRSIEEQEQGLSGEGSSGVVSVPGVGGVPGLGVPGVGGRVVFEAEDEGVSDLDVGVDEAAGVRVVSGSAGMVEGAEQVERGDEVPVEEEVEGAEQVPVETVLGEGVVRPARPARPEGAGRVVNPLFADPEVEDEVPVVEGVPGRRKVNPVFDFKVDRDTNQRLEADEADGLVDPDRLPVWMKTGPVVDAEGEEGFDVKPKREAARKPRGFRIQERDIVLLRFLTKYQFSYVDALARLLDSSPAAVTNRLRILESNNLVKRQNIAVGSTLWQTRKAGIELAGMAFKENKKSISFATVRHTVGLVNLAVELEREAAGSKDVLGLEGFGEEFPVKNRFPGGVRLYGEEAGSVDLVWGEMTVSEREIRQGQKRYRGGKSSSEMRDLVELGIQSVDAPELEEGNEGLFVVYGTGGKTGEHVPDLVVTRPRNPDGSPNHFAIELELSPKSPYDWKRILRSYREAGGMFSRVYYFTPDRPIANMIRNADEEVGLGDKLVIRKFTPRNKRQPFLG